MTKALQALADRPYGVVSRKQADEWLAAGLVRLAAVYPPPKRGVAVNLTARGRGRLAAQNMRHNINSPGVTDSMVTVENP